MSVSLEKSLLSGMALTALNGETLNELYDHLMNRLREVQAQMQESDDERKDNLETLRRVNAEMDVIVRKLQEMKAVLVATEIEVQELIVS
jgi:uncharacterized coiled-coil protein SlyX